MAVNSLVNKSLIILSNEKLADLNFSKLRTLMKGTDARL